MRWRHVTPRQAALTILHAWFGPAAAGSKGTIPLTEFQRAAFDRIQRISETRRGVLLADAVGLGKTYVALALIERTVQNGGAVVVVLPAQLRAHWQQHLRKLPRSMRVVPRLVTHTALSFGRLPAIEPALVVVDEAHAFRNPHTRRYQALARFVATSHVLLLTATPINNTLLDLYHQIRLFAGDDDFRDLGIVDLRHTWRSAGNDALARRAVQRVIEAVVVRRTRELVNEREQQRFARREPPHTVRYDLLSAYGPAWSGIYRLLGELTFACATGSGMRGATELMRLQLLKRLESSVVAFARSVRRQAELCELLLSALRKGCWIEPAALSSLVRDTELGTQLPIEQLLTRALPREIDAHVLQRALQVDRDLLRRCQQMLCAPLAAADPKLVALESLLHVLGPKVIVFTQFRDTAVHLWSCLHRRGRVGLVHGSDARLGARRAARSTVIECFAPLATGARKPAARLRLDTLIATDVLSEGMNLQDAHTVVNYDIPWNPVTLMQRMGRVDRLGSPHERVRLYNFVPDRGLDDWLGLIERVEAKLQVIQRTLGADQSVLEPAAETSARAALSIALRDDRPNSDVLEQHETMERLRARWQKEGAFIIPQKPVVSRLSGAVEGWLFAVDTQGSVRFMFVDGAGHVTENRQLTADLLQRALDLPDHGAKPGLPPWRVVADWLAAGQTTAAITDPATPESRAAALILRMLEQAPGAATLVRRADRLLRRLARPLDAAAAARLAAALEGSENCQPGDLIGLLEIALEGTQQKQADRCRFRPIGCLQIAPASQRKGPVDPPHEGR